MKIETDYMVVGAGASGLAFADTLLAENPDVDVTLVDTRPSPGGHWVDTYPFVRLHSPSAYYGVNSMPLGEDRIDTDGENAGFYERAGGTEIREYFEQAAARLTETGRARILTEHEHLGPGAGGEQLRDLDAGTLHEVSVRKKVVDARYLEAAVPATHKRPFEVAAGARVVPVGELPDAAESASSFTVLGSGKTAVDACAWLLGSGVDPGQIRWVRPREAWFHDRAHFQPLDQVGGIMEGLAIDAEAGALASDLGDLFARLEDEGRLQRIDPSQPADMYRGTMLSRGELEAVRQIEDVVRLGHVRQIEGDRLVLERGEVEAEPGALNVDCTALGLGAGPATPIFQPGRIVIQQVRHNSPCFNAALIAYVEAHRDGGDGGSADAERNRLCPPNPYASSIADWPGMMARTFKVEQQWLGETDLREWLTGCRLNLVAALPAHAGDPEVVASLQKYLGHVGGAVERLEGLSAGALTGGTPLAAAGG